MGLSEWKPDELLHMLKKREIDLQVMGMDIACNRPKIDVKTREMRTLPALQEIDIKIGDLVEIARELTSRNIPIKIDLSKQFPFIRERLEEAIQKAGLIKPKMLLGATVRKIPKKKSTPRRPKRRI